MKIVFAKYMTWTGMRFGQEWKIFLEYVPVRESEVVHDGIQQVDCKTVIRGIYGRKIS